MSEAAEKKKNTYLNGLQAHTHKHTKNVLLFGSAQAYELDVIGIQGFEVFIIW